MPATECMQHTIACPAQRNTTQGHEVHFSSDSLSPSQHLFPPTRCFASHSSVFFILALSITAHYHRHLAAPSSPVAVSSVIILSLLPHHTSSDEYGASGW